MSAMRGVDTYRTEFTTKATASGRASDVHCLTVSHPGEVMFASITTPRWYGGPTGCTFFNIYANSNVCGFNLPFQLSKNGGEVSFDANITSGYYSLNPQSWDVDISLGANDWISLTVGQSGEATFTVTDMCFQLFYTTGFTSDTEPVLGSYCGPT